MKIKTEATNVPGIEHGGGPAYPFVFAFKNAEGQDCTAFNSGMSVRDLAALEVLAQMAGGNADETYRAGQVVAAFDYAEAFLAERDRRDARDRAEPEARPDPDALAVVRQAVDLLEGDSTGADWKRGCRDFLKAAADLFKGGR